jgi:glycosyltransferase involved in cell wall biosynthesis
MNLLAAKQDSSREIVPHGTEQQWKGYVTVIVPVYNEASHVDRLLRAIEASPVPKEIIVVDDGSTDGTRERLLALSGTNRAMLIFHGKNHGKGAAIRTALRYARGEYVLIQDSDLEYDPRDYPALLEPLQSGLANVVYGVRPNRPGRGLHFFLGAKLLTIMTNLLYWRWIHDEATCYKVFRRSLLTSIPLKCRGFEFCPEVTAKLCRLGERIWEVPISYAPRTKKEGKKLRFSDGGIAIWTLLRYRFAALPRLVGSQGNEQPQFATTLIRHPPE